LKKELGYPKKKIGFTGTRSGLTRDQFNSLFSLLTEKGVEEFHHGDCIGADARVHHLIVDHFPDCKIIIHPPKDSKYRAFCWDEKKAHLKLCDLRPEKDYLERNQDIVDECDILIATPKEVKEVLRSGTWSTVRYASKVGKSSIIVYPDGSISKERVRTVRWVD
jgi:hypothetical protein